MRGTIRPARVVSTTLVFSAALLFVLGCGGGPKLVKVQGKVYLDDQPVAGSDALKGYVVFHADKEKGNTSQEVVQGAIGEDGTYVLFTREKEGATPGWYKVTVDLAETKANDPYYYKPKVDDKYLDLNKSGLVMEVIESPEAGRYDLKLPSRKK